MGWSTPRTWVAGEAPTAATLNTHIRDELNFLYDPPAVHVYVTAATTSIGTSGSWTDVSGYGEDNDTDSMWTSANAYVLINTAGRYLLLANARFDNATTTGLRGVRVAKSTDNGSTYTTYVANSLNGGGTGSNDCVAQAVIEIDVNAGDRLKMQVIQFSGGALNLIGNDRAYTYLSLRFVAP